MGSIVPGEEPSWEQSSGRSEAKEAFLEEGTEREDWWRGRETDQASVSRRKVSVSGMGCETYGRRDEPRYRANLPSSS